MLTNPEPIDLARLRVPGYQPHAVHRLVNRELCGVLAGACRGLVVSLPPQTGKSELSSRCLPAAWLGWYPRQWVQVVAATAQLAEGFSVCARELVREHGPGLFNVELAPGVQSKARWQTTAGGGVAAFGIDSQSSGTPAGLMVIDDTIPDEAAARNPAYLEMCISRYLSVHRARLRDTGAVVVVSTRWAKDDLAGWVVAHDTTRQWRVVSLPALATGDNDPLGRRPGEALCPEMFSREYVEATRDSLIAAGRGWMWAAEYQQQPQGFEVGSDHVWPDKSALRRRVLLISSKPATIYVGGWHAGRWYLDRTDSTDLVADAVTAINTWLPERVIVARADLPALRHDLRTIGRRVFLPPLRSVPCPALPCRLLRTSRVSVRSP